MTIESKRSCLVVFQSLELLRGFQSSLRDNVPLVIDYSDAILMVAIMRVASLVVTIIFRVLAKSTSHYLLITLRAIGFFADTQHYCSRRTVDTLSESLMERIL